jgi:hypothetical protein
LTHCPKTTHCPIVLKTALNHIIILHDENHAYFVVFSKNKKLDKSAVKKLRYQTNKIFCTPEDQFGQVGSKRFK